MSRCISDTNFRQQERLYLTPPETPRKIIGRCAEVGCQEILTDDYTYYSDFEGNLFCSHECALTFYGVREV